MALEDAEGRICRWCHEGEYTLYPNENLRMSQAGDDQIKCNVCGDPPMTFEEAEAARISETTG